MEIKKIAVSVRDLCAGYVNESDVDIENGVYAYGGKLCVRPAFQRAFVYDKEQENAVIDTALKGFPLNIMYWVDNGDGTYDCLDGQQRTISLSNFVDGVSSFSAPWLCGNDPKKRFYFNTLKRTNPNLAEAYYYRAAIKRDFQNEGFVDDYRKAVQLKPELKALNDADVLTILKI